MEEISNEASNTVKTLNNHMVTHHPLLHKPCSGYGAGNDCDQINNAYTIKVHHKSNEN